MNLAFKLLLLLEVLHSCFNFGHGLRCYDGSGAMKADSLPRDPNMVPPAAGTYWNHWNYQTVLTNCTSCRSVIISQEPEFGSNYPSVIMNLICEKTPVGSLTSDAEPCEITETKYAADLKAVTAKNPQGRTPLFIQSLMDFAGAAPTRILPNAQRSCSRCTTDFCNSFNFLTSVSCSVGYGLQSHYSEIGHCPLGQGCFVERNVTVDDTVIIKATCAPYGCTAAALDSCINSCQSSISGVKKCLCWCNGDYRIYGDEAIGGSPSSRTGAAPPSATTPQQGQLIVAVSLTSTLGLFSLIANSNFII